MLKLLKGEGALSLTDVISRLYEETGKMTAPQGYREFLSELARNTPICGMIQIAGKPEIMEIGIDVRQASQRQEFKLLQMHAPVIASFINKLANTDQMCENFSGN